MLPRTTIQLAKDIDKYGIEINDINLSADFERPRKLAVNGRSYVVYTALDDVYYRFFYLGGELAAVAEQPNFEDSMIVFSTVRDGKIVMLGELKPKEIKAKLAAGVAVTLFDTVFIEDALATAECDRLLHTGG